MFNRFLENPTFSFVREQNKYISATNKRELLDIEDAPSTYLFNFSGRIQENIGAGIAVFQKDFGVLSTFGGIANFAYNIRIQEDSNLTFATNVGAYKSGINAGNVNVNFQDPALDNVPTSFLVTASPSINYGTGFMDFGLTLSNVATYNFKTATLLEENAEKAIQGHIMYTGYLGGYGFFGESRFSALGKTEFQKDDNIISGMLMLTVPKGIWAQVGYNTIYGASGGIGVNLTPQLAIEYNFEKPFMGLSDLGSAHEITLAYRFKNSNYYDYSRDDEMAGLIMPGTGRKKKAKKKAVVAKVEPQAVVAAQEEVEKALEEIEANIGLDARTKLAEEKRAEAKAAADERDRIAEENLVTTAVSEEERIAAENKAIADAAELERIATEAKAKADAAERARIAAENKAIADAAELERIAAEEKAKANAAELERIAAEEKAKADAAELENIAAEEARETAISNPTDAIGQEMTALTLRTAELRAAQTSTMGALNEAIESKNKDLKDLREENDLSEQGIFVTPKPFKSVTAENQAIEALKLNIEETIAEQGREISVLEELYAKRVKEVSDRKDETNSYFKNRIEELKNEQKGTERSSAFLLSTLNEINEATAIERKRRIKKATYNNEADRFTQDKAKLDFIKRNTALLTTPLGIEAFDFGEERNNNIQILKNVANTENGFYAIIAVHNNVIKRDDFLTKAIASGSKNIDFFYNVNTSKYYIYTERYDSLQEANQALDSQTDTMYNSKTSIVKIEN
jgi:type IX secretion system PorP/SprF family membrane protein